MHDTARALASCRHPLVAQIHGICVGGGLEIAALCDLRICGASSRFGAPIKNLGLVMAYAEMAPLVALVGRAVALELLLEGRILDAAEAKEKGLVTRVVPDADVAAEARATAQRIAEGAPARRALAQEVRAPARGSATALGRGRGRVLRLLRHRGLPHRLRGVPREDETRVPRAMNADALAAPGAPHPGPLAGMRVLELAQIMAGPTCGALLADLGADVIKVEKLPGGDDARGYREPRVNGVSAPFLMLNRNKRGLALDLKRPEGRAILLRLVRHADVLIENYRRGTMEKLGLGYDVLAVENPALIYCAITGYGRDGPWADKGGFDLVAQAFAGLMAITGEPGRPPAKTGNPVSDINAGILGRGRHPRRMGAPAANRTRADRRHVAHGGRAAADVLARGELLRDGRVAGPARLRAHPDRAVPGLHARATAGSSSAARTRRTGSASPTCSAIPNGATIRASRRTRRGWRTCPRSSAAMNEVLVRKTRAEWLAALDAAGVPAGPVHSLGEALTHPQTLARGMVVDLDHPDAGPTKALGCPIHLSDSPARVDRPAPRLGEHTRELLRECGYADAEIDAFIAAGIVAAAETV